MRPRGTVVLGAELRHRMLALAEPRGAKHAAERLCVSPTTYARGVAALPVQIGTARWLTQRMRDIETGHEFEPEVCSA